jgi:carbon-monoxide dehydrogenase large subunit
MSNAYFGRRLERREDAALLTGRGQFVDDLDPPGTLTAHFVRSVHGHARLKHVDVSAARACSGVHAVYAFVDLPVALREKPFPLLAPDSRIRQPLTYLALAKDEVHYVGEPIAVIVADTRALAEDAAEKVTIDYDALPVVSDCREALRTDAARVHLGTADNVAATFIEQYGDVDAALARAPHRVHESFWQHRGCGHAMEGRAVLAIHNALDNSLAVWSATQAPYLVKLIITAMLGWDDSKIRVVAPDVGGGFGPKGMIYQEEVVVPALAAALGRPVRWTEDRREQAISTTQERDQYCEADIGFDDDGHLIAVKVSLIHDTGAYLPWGIITTWIGASTLPGPYVLPNYRMDVTVALTNKVGTSPVRGTGRPQAVFIMERLIDRMAQALHIDPVVARERNLVRPHQMPYEVDLVGRDNKKVQYDSGDYPRCQALALERADYVQFHRRQAAARAHGRFIGIGVATYVESTGLGPYEGALARILPSGKLGIFTGAASQGQGHKTMLAQIAADAFGTQIEEVEVTAADTALFPMGVGTFGSRIAVNAGSSVHNAVSKLRGRVLKLAARVLQIDEANLEIAPGAVRVSHMAGIVRQITGAPRQIRLQDLLHLSLGYPGFSMEAAEPGLAAIDYFFPPHATYPNGTHVAEVEVDPELGCVDILRYTVGHDCGRIINPLIVDGQIRGGVAQGIGNALLEYMFYDGEAQPQTTTLEEYLLPAIADVPKIDIVHMESPSPLNPIGVKGAGEAGTIPAAAAIIAAVEDALAPFGIKINEAPISAERIVALVERSQTKPSSFRKARSPEHMA